MQQGLDPMIWVHLNRIFLYEDKRSVDNVQILEVYVINKSFN